MSMRICIVTETFYPSVGGGESQCRSLAEELVAKKHAVLVVTRRHIGKLMKEEPFDGVQIHRVQPSGPGRLKKWGFLFSIVPELIRLRSRFDLVLVSGFRIVGLSSLLVSRVLGKPCILKADSPGEMSGEYFQAGLQSLGLKTSWLPVRAALKVRGRLLKNASAFVAMSSEIRQEFRSSGLDSSVIEVIPNAVDTNIFRPVSSKERHALRLSLNLPRQSKIVIFTGRLVTYKGLPSLLEVWRRFGTKRSDVTLVLVGSGGLDIHNCEEELHEFVRHHELADCVRFTGAVHNVHEYLQASDVFVLPTQKEAFGVSLIEAMACQLPVVCTPAGGVREIVTDGKDGIVVPFGRTEELYDALDRLLSDETFAGSLGRAARATVKSQYSLDQVVERYESLFRNVLRTTKSARLNGAAPEPLEKQW